MMELQRQSPALFHHDALDLVAITEIERLIGAPGPVHLQVILRKRRRDLPQPLDDAAQPIAALAARHQHRIVCRNDHHIVEAEQRHELLVARHIGAACVDKDSLALPCAALPSASRPDNSQTACQEPTSDQP